jgi:hypothetical protein
MIVYQGETAETLEPDDLTRSMFTWAESIGVRLSPKLRYPVRFHPGYLGVQTLEAISPCEDLLFAPNQSMLSTKLMNPPELHALYSNHPEFFSLPDKSHEDYRMIAFMVFEQSKEEKSFWKSYLDFLPKDVETIIDWSDSDLKELQDEDFEYDSRFRRDRDVKGNQDLSEVLKNYEIFNEKYLNLTNLNWVWKILCTRSYGRCVPFNSLIPLADLFNHSNVNTNYFYASQNEPCPDASSEELKIDFEDTDDPLLDKEKPVVFSSLKLHRLAFASLNKDEDLNEKSKIILQQARLDDSQSFVKKMNAACKSAEYGAAPEEENSWFRISCSKFERYEPGAQVFISYGKYSNRQLLTNYGFALVNNPYNYARIKVKLKDFLNEQQKNSLSGGFKPESDVLFKVKKHEMCVEMLKVIRCFLWTPEISPNAFLKPADLKLEVLAVRRFKEMLEEVYQAFPTTLEDDRELLKEATGKRYLAILYRAGVKEIYLQQVKYCNIALELLDMIAGGYPLTVIEEITSKPPHISEKDYLLSSMTNYLTDLKEFN